jgi:hypothetical protein
MIVQALGYMGKIIGNLVVAFLASAVMALFAYDMIVVRPHLASLEAILAQANPEDASPPKIIRDLIDANAGSPIPYATRLVILRVDSDLNQRQWLLHSTLWGVLLPMHFDESQMYGLYAVLSYNGVDDGLSNFAHREYGQSLGQLSPLQAATTVAITSAPTLYHKDRDRLDRRARALLEKMQSRHAHP